MASTPEGSIGNPPSGSATPVSSIPQTTAVKEQPTSAAPLSASANAFNPGTNNQELLSPSAVLWGISRTTSTAGAPTSSSSNNNSNVDASNVNTAGSSSSAPGSNAGTPSKSNTDASSSSATAAGATQGGASESLGGLWNFGGFDVDALTNENNHTHHPSNHHPQPSGGHHPHNMGGRNGSNINQGDVSGLSSAFGNFGLQQGSSSATTDSGMNNTYGGSDYGGNKYGAPQAGKYTIIRKQRGEKAGKDRDILFLLQYVVYVV